MLSKLRSYIRINTKYDQRTHCKGQKLHNTMYLPGKAVGKVYADRVGAAEAGLSAELALPKFLRCHSASRRRSNSSSSGAVSDR